MANHDPALVQQQFDIAKTEWKHNVQPHCLLNDFSRETVIFEQIVWYFHIPIMPHSLTRADNLTMPE